LHIKAEKEKKIIQPTQSERRAAAKREKNLQPLLCKIKEFGIIFHMRASPFEQNNFLSAAKGRRGTRRKNFYPRTAPQWRTLDAI
jgi:hypothetical protein